MQAAVGHVIKCALDVQAKNGEYLTSVGVVLKVKIGIAAGEVIVLCVGNNDQRSYVEMGRAVDAVNKAENFCKKGDVVVSPTAWCHCYRLTMEHTLLADGKHVKVTALLGVEPGGPNYVMRRTIHVSPSMENLDMSVTNLQLPAWVLEEAEAAGSSPPGAGAAAAAAAADKKSGVGGAAMALREQQQVLAQQQRHSSAFGRTATDQLYESESGLRRLRKAVISRFDDGTIEKLKLYVAQPVLKKLDEDQPLDYLSEMRQVTIIFI